MKINKNREINPAIWNHLVNNKIFFRFEWLYIIEKVYKLKPYFFLLHQFDKFALIGSFKTYRGYISLPFVSYSGFFSNDKETLKKLKSYLLLNNIDIDSRELTKSEVNSGYVNPIATFYSMDDFWRKIQPRFRTLMRKSEKSNYIFYKENDIENFYKLYSIGMKNFGTPLHSKRFFIEMIKYFKFHIFSVFEDHKPIGSMFCLSDNDTLAVLYSYVLEEYKKKYVNYFLYLNVVKWMINNKLIHLDLGRSTYGKGTFYFKKKFRPKIYGIKSRLNYSSNKKLDVLSKIWKHLPLSVTNILGPKLRIYLP